MKTVLIIDDEVDIQDALGFFLKRRGYEVLLASNGEEGLRCLQSSPLKPDLVLLDGNMPVMNGRAFLKIRKDLNLAPDTQIILLSSDLWDTHDATIVRQVPKPFDLNFLLATIESVLNRAPLKDLSN